MTTDWAASRSGISRSQGSGCGSAEKTGSATPRRIASKASGHASALHSPDLDFTDLRPVTLRSGPFATAPVPRHRLPWKCRFQVMRDF